MTDLILRAAKFAADCHHGQVRKHNGRPYITHPCRVAGLAAIHPLATPEFVAAAYLHDVIEDCQVYHDDLQAHFGVNVANLVLELTNPSKELTGVGRRERKRIDRDHLEQASREAKVLKLLDRIDNVREMDTGNVEFLAKYYQESILLAQVLRDADENLYQELMGIVSV